MKKENRKQYHNLFCFLFKREMTAWNEVESLIVLPTVRTHCKLQSRFTMSPALGLMVVCDDLFDDLKVLELPPVDVLTTTDKLSLVSVLRGQEMEPPVPFDFRAFGRHECTGVEFLQDGSPRVVVVSGYGGVFVLDIMRKSITGDILPGSTRGDLLNGFAVCNGIVALAIMEYPSTDVLFLDTPPHPYEVRLFKEHGSAWCIHHVICCNVDRHGWPGKLAFTADGAGIIMSARETHEFRVAAGSHGSHGSGGDEESIRLPLPDRVQIIADLANGWLVQRKTMTMGDCRQLHVGYIAKNAPHEIRVLHTATATACAWVPDIGLFVLGPVKRWLTVLAIPDVLRMASMSTMCVSWMGAVYRACYSVRRKEDSRSVLSCPSLSPTTKKIKTS